MCLTSCGALVVVARNVLKPSVKWAKNAQGYQFGNSNPFRDSEVWGMVCNGWHMYPVSVSHIIRFAAHYLRNQLGEQATQFWGPRAFHQVR